jgi:UDP-N-acetylglucosamine--N-acetylmuramyl-(pentapeptide) pyrophosphoryl-undecaprenol N-acetylglucosamine transferase
MRIAFAGGVTGGHIAPGVALAEKVLESSPGSDVLFAGVDNRVERRMIVRRGLRLVGVSDRRGKAGVPGALVRSCRLFRSFRPDAVVGLGGVASAGPLSAGLLMRTPLVLMEQNVIPGRTNRWLARWARRICCQWPEAARRLGPAAVATGSPVRSEIHAARNRDKADARAELGLAPGRTTLLVLGGSQGAHAINGFLMGAAARLAKRVQVVHAAGPADRPAVAQAYGAAGMKASVAGFFDEMDTAYAAADLAVSRAGALSIAELACAGVPAVLVPYPSARDDHQRANARAAAEQGWAVMADEPLLDPGGLASRVEGLLEADGRLDEMRDKATASACTSAEQVVFDILCEVSQAKDGRPAVSPRASGSAE